VSVGLFLALAGFGGAFSATGANVLAWSAHRTRVTGKDFTKMQNVFFVAVCFFLNLAGIALFALSTALGGAVATVMPVQTGANLLANMFWQTFLGMKYFDKSMRVGTMVLICAVAELSEIGPNEPADLPALELLTHQAALLWTIFLIVCTALCMLGCYRTFNQPVTSAPKLIFFTLLTTFSTVIGCSVGKCLALVKGPALVLVVIIYFLDGCLVMGSTVLANAHCDVALFIPAQLSSQLVINMITGYLVWGDAKYVKEPVAYILVYLLCILGVYLNSPDMDLVGDFFRRHYIRQSRLSEGVAQTKFGHAVVKLLSVWRRQQGERCAETEMEACREAVKDVLQVGLETGSIKSAEVTALCLRLLQEQGFGPGSPLVHWIEQDVQHFKAYCSQDPAFKDEFRKTLSAEEQGKLALLQDRSLPAGSLASNAGISLEEGSYLRLQGERAGSARLLGT